MARTPKIPINGDVLRWAREQRGLGLEVAAKRLKITPERLAGIEAGDEDPTVAKLREMSEKYKRPLIVLLLDGVPQDFTALKDFRSLRSDDESSYSPALRDEIRRAREQQEIFAELNQALGEELVTSSLPTGTNAQELGTALRDYLDLDEVALVSTRNADDQLALWRSAVEAKGILVLQASRVKVGEMRGFSLSDEQPHVIVLNGQDAARGKIFTLLHELAHLSSRSSGLCDLHSQSREPNDIEVFCNAVAGEAILPSARLLAMPVVANHMPGRPWTDRELEAIQKVAGGASREVVLRRLVALGRATREEYKAKRDEYRDAYEEWRRDRNKASSGGPPPHRMQLRDRGRVFVRSVFDAHADGFVTLAELTDLVGVKTQHLQKLQEAAYS